MSFDVPGLKVLRRGRGIENPTAMSAPCSAGVDDGITFIAKLATELPNQQTLKDLKCASPEEFDQRSR